MRDIQQVLERWGAWAAANHENVCWPPVAAGFKGLIPEKVKSRLQCCDDDGITISNVMAGIRSQNPVAHDLLFEFYIMGKSIAQLSRDYHCSDTHAGKKLQWAEGVFAGYLMGLDIKLEMDREVRMYEHKAPLD